MLFEKFDNLLLMLEKQLPQSRVLTCQLHVRPGSGKLIHQLLPRKYSLQRNLSGFVHRNNLHPANSLFTRSNRFSTFNTEYLLVDGYNIIFAWDELNALSKESLDAARHRLMDILCNYQGFKKCVLILVFDAYRVPGSPGSIEQYHNIHVVYTKEAETADMFIERVTHEIGRNRRVRVATSDGMEQVIILGHGALRVSARMFHEEVQDVEKEIRRCIQGEA